MQARRRSLHIADVSDAHVDLLATQTRGGRALRSVVVKDYASRRLQGERRRSYPHIANGGDNVHRPLRRHDAERLGLPIEDNFSPGRESSARTRSSGLFAR